MVRGGSYPYQERHAQLAGCGEALLAFAGRLSVAIISLLSLWESCKQMYALCEIALFPPLKCGGCAVQIMISSCQSVFHMR